MMKTLLALFWLCAALPASWAEDSGDSAGDIAAAVAARPDLQQDRTEEKARELSRRWQQQRQVVEPGAAGEGLDDQAMAQMLAHVPSGPPQMDDLRREAAEERAQIGFESIDSYVEAKASGIRGLARQYLIQVFFYGHAGNQLGAFIHNGLTTPGGWNAFPTMSYRSLPTNIAGLYSGGHVDIDPAKGNNTIVVSHEWWHHMGKPDPPDPDNAYVWMGKEFGGGPGLPGSGSIPGEGSYAFQCGR